MFYPVVLDSGSSSALLASEISNWDKILANLGFNSFIMQGFYQKGLAY